MVINMKLFKRENYLKKIRGFYDATDIIKVITKYYKLLFITTIHSTPQKNNY